MTTDPSHLIPLPDGLTEDDVLAWIECELPPARHEDVGRAIDADAVVAGRMRRMRADCGGGRALPGMQGPVGRMGSGGATPEREGVPGGAGGVELVDGPPGFIVSSARPPPAARRAPRRS